jgi:predicted  nucleic acid-binding Zn-ribbon protein
MAKKLKKITTIEDLATLMQQEFLDIHEKVGDGFLRVESRLDKVESCLDNVESRLDTIEQELRELKMDLEDMKLRYADVAFRFELREMEKRVQRLELKLAK